MALFRWISALGLLVAFSLGLTAAGSAASATQITNLRVDPEPNGGTAVTVLFNGTPPQVTPVGIGTAQVTLVIPGVTAGPLVPPMTTGTGVIQNVAITQSPVSTSIFVRLTSAQPVRFRAQGLAFVLDVPPASTTDFLQPVPQPAALQGAPAAGTLTLVIPLKYADVSEIAGVLVQGSNVASNDVFSPIQTNIGTNQLNGTFGGVNGGFQSNSSQQSFGGGAGFNANGSNGLAQRLNDSIAIDRRLNAIILTGTQDVIDAYKSTIDKIDVPVPSVILETEIVELDETAAQNIGIEYAPGGTGIVVNGSPSTSTTTGLTTVQNGLVISTGNKPQGAVSLAANLYAEVSKGSGKVLAKPRILAQSGQQASILTGDAIPIITSVVLTGASAVTSQQVAYINVGVDLQILPRVSSDGFVTSHIYSEVSSVTNFVQGIPQISQRTANTSATVKDGESFVIGGLLEDNEIKNLNKVPFIGDLPLIGVFFRFLSTSHTQSNLYIVVTPHIVGSILHPPGPQPYAPQPVVPVVLPPGASPAPTSSP
jgi:general secretion pathway protein D